MKFFRKRSQRPKAANYFHKITPPQAFHWGVNAPPEQNYTYNYIDIHRSIYVFFRLLQNINRDGSVIQFPGYAIVVGYM